MDAAHAHLILNHIPVVGLGAAILLLLYAFARKNDEMKKAALAGFALLALVAIPVYLTGKGAEDLVEHLPGVTEAYIEQHEEAATASLIAIELLGALSLAGLVLTSPLERHPEVVRSRFPGGVPRGGWRDNVDGQSGRADTSHGNPNGSVGAKHTRQRRR